MLSDVPTLEDSPEFSRALWKAFKRVVADHADDGPADLHTLALDAAGANRAFLEVADATIHAACGRTLSSLIDEVAEEVQEDDEPLRDDEYEELD
jgi:hypothetical protein